MRIIDVRRVVGGRVVPFEFRDHDKLGLHGVLLRDVPPPPRREEQKIKFPNVDLVVDQHGINSLSDPNMHFDRIKIETKRIKVPPDPRRNWKCWGRAARERFGAQSTS
jgi:hypothetical protein